MATLLSAASSLTIPTLAQVQQHARDFLGVDFYRSLTPDVVRKFTFTAATPLSSTVGVITAVVLYFALVKAMQLWVQKRGKPYQLKEVGFRAWRSVALGTEFS
jgi:hypothetical protein